jgi:hypothetical protein
MERVQVLMRHLQRPTQVQPTFLQVRNISSPVAKDNTPGHMFDREFYIYLVAFYLAYQVN